MSDWQDRWVDAGLQELHGSRPPDLSARVLLALDEAPAGALPTLRPRRGAGLRYGLVAAAFVLLGIAVGALLPPARTTAEPVVQLDVHVRTGELLSVEIESAGVRRSRHTAGDHAVFVPRVGNRLLTAAPSRFQVGPFGELATGPATELEVRSMTVNWQRGVVLGSSLTIAVVAGVVTWHSLSQSGTAKAGEVVHLEAGAPTDGTDQAAEIARLRERLRQSEQRNADLQAALQRDEAAAAPRPVEEPPPPPPPEEPVVASGAVFKDSEHDEALAALDWQLMGQVTHEMGPKLIELIRQAQETGEMPEELAIEISALNLKLVQQVPALMKSGLPGSGPNGAYTHPLVSANILAKTLDAAGLSLDQAQQDRIAGLVRSASVETQAVADATQEFELQRLQAEADTKDRFYREMSSLLTPEQAKVMFPEGARDFDGGSLFHSSLFTRQFFDGVAAKNPGEFAQSVAESYGKKVGLDEQASAQVRSIVERMATSPELWGERAGSVETGPLHMTKAGRIQTAMRYQVDIMREILRTVPMTPAQKKKFLAMKTVFVPLPQ